MKLPPIQFSLPVIFLIWCVAGVYTHGPVMLAYPAIWGTVGLLFLGLNFWLKSTSSGDRSANSG